MDYEAAAIAVAMFDGTEREEDWAALDDFWKSEYRHQAREIVDAALGDKVLYKLCDKCDGFGEMSEVPHGC